MPVLIDNKVVNLNSGLQTLRFRDEILQYDGKMITLDELKAKSRQNPAEEIRVKVVGGQAAAPTAGPAAPPPPPQHTVNITVHAYTPDLSTLRAEPPQSRFAALSTHLSAMNTKPDVLLVPEYFFNWKPSGVAPPSDRLWDSVKEAARKVPCIGGEHPEAAWNIAPMGLSARDALLRDLHALSRGNPETVIVPGTLVWYNTKSRTGRTALSNTSYVLKDGVDLTTGVGYNKQGVSYERDHLSHDSYIWTGGGSPRFDFEHKGLRCRLSICRDAGSKLQSESEANYEDAVDLQLIVASKLPAYASEANTRNGGGCVHADGDGFSVSMKRLANDRQADRQQNNGSHTYTLDVAANEPQAAAAAPASDQSGA